MRPSPTELRDCLVVAGEALGRYKLRTALSVCGVVLGVAAVIAMMSVSEGASREALAQVEELGLDNLIARNRAATLFTPVKGSLTAADAARIESLVPFVRAASPLIDRYVRVAYRNNAVNVHVLGVRPEYQQILRLSVLNGRFLSATDEKAAGRVCVIGSGLARQLFGFRDPIDERIAVGSTHYRVVGVLDERGGGRGGAATLAWRDVNQSIFVPFPALSGRSPFIAPAQGVDEIWVQIEDGARAEEVAGVFAHALTARGAERPVDVIVPRELLAQRQRTQRTFSIVIGSVAALALLIGGIGIMNIMLTSVLERTHEIGIRRTVGATREHVLVQFLLEAVLMTLTGGIAGIAAGAVVSLAIASFAGWATYVSLRAVALGFLVSCGVGISFGVYPAIRAAALEPVDAVRYE
jgi:putative ABC transport system permease protein